MATRSVLERSRSALHLRLLAAQRRLATKQYGAVIVIGGNDRLAASELANQLTEWFDARTVRVCAPDATSAGGRPFLWPYWQDVPAKGRITIVVGDWLTRTAVEAAHDELNGERLRSRLKSIRTFEEMLAADGTSVVKVWLETPDKSLRKRLQSRLGILNQVARNEQSRRKTRESGLNSMLPGSAAVQSKDARQREMP